MDTEKFKVIIVEDVKLELKGTEEIFRHEIPNAEVIGTAMTEAEFWLLLESSAPDMVLLDLGLGGSTTIGVDICASLRKNYPNIKVLIFTGEILNEKLWVDALNAGADGIILKTGELLTAGNVLRDRVSQEDAQSTGHRGWGAVMSTALGAPLVGRGRGGFLGEWQHLGGAGWLSR